MSTNPKPTPLQKALETSVVKRLRCFSRETGGGFYSLSFLVQDYRRDGYSRQEVHEAVNRLAARREVEIKPCSNIILLRAR